MLSAHEDLFDLILVRWKKYEQWSPWNCILLTKEEASAHAKLENVTEVRLFSLFVFVVLNPSPIDGCGERCLSKPREPQASVRVTMITL